MKKRILINFSFLKYRFDLQNLIKILEKNFNVTIFDDISKKEIKKTNNLIYRIYNKFLFYFLKLFIKNDNEFNFSYYETIRLKYGNNKITEKLFFYIRKCFPKFFNYNALLNFQKINFSIDNFDYFLFATPIDNQGLFNYLISEKKNIFIYVYSWDHSYKFNFHNLDNCKYLVWDEFTKNHISSYHNIKLNNIDIVGSTQFSVIDNYLKNNDDKSNNLVSQNKTILFVCAAGYEKLLISEFKIIENLKKISQKHGYKLLIRKYPHSNVNFKDKYFKNFDFVEYSSPESYDEYINFSYDKFNLIKQSTFVIHCGTTVGLEAKYLSRPSFLIDISDLSKNEPIKEFVNAPHIKDNRFMSNDAFVIHKYSDFEKLLIEYNINPKFHSILYKGSSNNNNDFYKMNSHKIATNIKNSIYNNKNLK